MEQPVPTTTAEEPWRQKGAGAAILCKEPPPSLTHALHPRAAEQSDARTCVYMHCSSAPQAQPCSCSAHLCSTSAPAAQGTCPHLRHQHGMAPPSSQCSLHTLTHRDGSQTSRHHQCYCPHHCENTHKSEQVSTGVPLVRMSPMTEEIKSSALPPKL